MRVIVTGGGTGGHIYPALAIADKIKSEFNEVEILYVGTRNGMESKIVPDYGYKYMAIRAKGIRRKLTLDNLGALLENLKGIEDSKKILKDFNPDLIIGTGGYVSGPIVLLASINNIPTIIHEQNSYPGITNRILSKFVSRIAINFEESSKYFDSKKTVITGNPIREEFFEVNKEKSYRELNIDRSKKFVMSIGGSSGQKSLNEAMLGFIIRNIDKGLQILHVTGKNHYDSFINKLRELGIKEIPENIKIYPYFKNISKGLSIADLVITSSGAITLSEITAIGVPSILIPKSYTTENHQEHNARAIERKGAAKVILEKELTSNKLDEEVWKLLNDQNLLNSMRINSKKLGIKDAASRIVNIVKEILR